MTKGSRLVLLSLLLAIMLAVSLTYFFLSRTGEKPTCNCFFPNSGRYGVIIDGKCVETDCERPQSRTKGED